MDFVKFSNVPITLSVISAIYITIYILYNFLLLLNLNILKSLISEIFMIIGKLKLEEYVLRSGM